MESKNRGYVFLGLIFGLASFLIWMGLLGVSQVQAQPPPPDDDDLPFIAFFTDELSIQISDLSGNVVAEGTHLGKVRCNRSNCNQKIDIELLLSAVFPTPTNIEYKFTTGLALDPLTESAVVGGTGSIINDHMKERFSFTATFKNNGDGTVTVRYEASRPDASLTVRSPGSFVIETR